MAEGKVAEFRTEPPNSPRAILNALGENKGFPIGGDADQQRAWWNGMYRSFFAIADWLLWLSDKAGLANDRLYAGQAYDLWRLRLKQAPEQMSKSAEPADKQLMNEMLELLKIDNPNPDQLRQVWLKFDTLHLVYGTKVPADIRKQLLNRP